MNVAGGNQTITYAAAPPGGPEFASLEVAVGDLFAQMRANIEKDPLQCEFVVLKAGERFEQEPGNLVSIYCEDQIPDLRKKIGFLLSYDLLLRLPRYNNFERYAMRQSLVNYLKGTKR
jgi:hypothetical protein